MSCPVSDTNRLPRGDSEIAPLETDNFETTKAPGARTKPQTAARDYSFRWGDNGAIVEGNVLTS